MDVLLPPLHPGSAALPNTRRASARLRAPLGKTRLGAALCVAVGLHRGRAWWVAPSYKMAAVGWRLVRQLGQQVPGAQIKQADQMVLLPGGGTVQVRSADDPQSLRGEGIDFVVMDECAFIQEAAWTEALRPALSDRLGRALFISTPKGSQLVLASLEPWPGGRDGVGIVAFSHGVESIYCSQRDRGGAGESARTGVRAGVSGRVRGRCWRRFPA